MTKAAMMGWFALTSPEASAIKHEKHIRRGGGLYYFLTDLTRSSELPPWSEGSGWVE